MKRKLVDRWWTDAQDAIDQFQDSRNIDRPWDEIWMDSPRGSEEQKALMQAAMKLQESVELVEKAWKLAIKRGGPTF